MGEEKEEKQVIKARHLALAGLAPSMFCSHTTSAFPQSMQNGCIPRRERPVLGCTAVIGAAPQVPNQEEFLRSPGAKPTRAAGLSVMPLLKNTTSGSYSELAPQNQENLIAHIRVGLASGKFLSPL